MSYDSRPQEAVIGASALLLLFECDPDGKIVWMNAAARSSLGAPSNMMQAISNLPSGSDWAQVRVTRVFEGQNRLLVRLDFGSDSSSNGQSDVAGLRKVEGRLAGNTIRLRHLEDRLASQVRRKRQGAGRKIVKMMDLERQRLARELHTGVGQALAAIGLQLEVIQALVLDPEPGVRTALLRIGELSQMALAQVRAVSHRLQPPDWQRLSLADALTQLWNLSGVPERFQATFHVGLLGPDPPHASKVLFYRAAQEAISNLVRHSGATAVRLTLETTGDFLTLMVSDNGHGFDTERYLLAPPTVSGGIGLRSVREQVEALGGEFRIRSGENGTKLEVALPAILSGDS